MCGELRLKTKEQKVLTFNENDCIMIVITAITITADFVIKGFKKKNPKWLLYVFCTKDSFVMLALVQWFSLITYKGIIKMWK